MANDANRRAALAFGIALPLLQMCRSVCFGNLPEQFADPSRHAGPQAMVLVFKGVLFIGAVLGFIGAVRGTSGLANEGAA